MSWYPQVVVIYFLFASCQSGVSAAECATGFWGGACKEKCAPGCHPAYGCDIVTGVCHSCIDAYYGPHCDSECSEHCRQCEKDTGVCTSCERTWYGQFCNDRCSAKCQLCDISTGLCGSCVIGHWGNRCENKCQPNGACDSNCTDLYDDVDCRGFCTCGQCNKNTGDCTRCASGFWGHGCDRICPENCRYGCDMTDGECWGSCAEGYWGRSCQFRCRSELCLRCSSSGFCYKCSNGTWGELCQRDCKPCETCDLNWGHCVKCPDGYYGRRCDSPCEHCLTCNMDNGRCESCRPGYWGENCEQLCPEECSCCDISRGSCTTPECMLDEYDHNSSTNGPVVADETSSDDGVPTLTIVGIAMIVVSIVVCAVCITVMVCLIRRLRSTSERAFTRGNNGKNDYINPIPKPDPEQVYDCPAFDDRS